VGAPYGTVTQPTRAHCQESGKGVGSKRSGRRVPRQLKIIRGTFRNDRNPEAEPEPTKVDAIPGAPSYLGAQGKALWRRIAGEMVRAKILTTVDLAALEILCSSYEEFREAREAVYTTAKGKPRTLRQYMRGKNSQTMPEYNAMKTARQEYKAYAAEFGLTPASRNRIEIAAPKDPEVDPMEQLLGSE
jgi:P27 family predicted phage terminase small subunit